MNSKNQEGLNNILQAMNNIVEPKISNLRYDKTYQGKIVRASSKDEYIVLINGAEYNLNSNEALSAGDLVKVKAPLNNFSNIYVEHGHIQSYKLSEIDQDFNTIISPGIYYHGSQPTGSNRPINKTGVLEVFTPNGIDNPGGLVIQKYTTYDGQETFSRGYYRQEGWSSWKKY